jgi:hypothetical protein
MLAFNAEMGAATGQKDSADGGGTDQARLPGSEVDAVLELKEAADAGGIYVVGNGGTTE